MITKCSQPVDTKHSVSVLILDTILGKATMRHLQIPLAFIFGLLAGPALAQSGNGLKTLESAAPAAVTIEKLEAIITAKGMKVFTRIDHAAAAKEAGLAMPPATVIIFGNPKGGTPNFLKAPTLAIDLPLRALVWQDQSGKTYISWNAGDYVTGTLFPRHGLNPPAQAGLDQENLLSGIMAEAVK